MRRLRSIANALIGLSATIAALALFTVTAIILADVVARAFGRPIYGAQDITTMAMVLVVFGAMALCDRRGGHVAVDLFERRFPDRLNRLLDILWALAAALIFATLAWAALESARLSQMLNLATNLIDLPKAWFQWALAAFAALTALGAALRAAELALRGEDVRSREGDLR